jgi:Fic family protein
MKRGRTGRIEKTTYGAEQVRAFALQRRPLTRLQEAADATSLTFPTAGTGIQILVDLGIARELTGKPRNRVFAYDTYLSILNEGTEPR